MIFGFNTEVKFGDTLYHVQSEARVKDFLLQTQVFIKGRCVGKHASSYAMRATEPDFSDEHMHDLLKEQHKQFVIAVREGRIEDLLDHKAKKQAAGESTLPDIPLKKEEPPAPPPSEASAAAPAPEPAPATKSADDSDILDLS